MYRLVCLLIGYGFGCIQSAYIVGKLIARIDIREHGSGNAGTSNVIRVVGRAAGALVFLFDFFKAFGAYALCVWLFDGSGPLLPAADASGALLLPGVLPGLYAGLGVLLGHNFPFFLKFKGGKGFASLLGLALALDFRVALIAYGVVVALIVCTRYISLSALTMSLLTPFFLWAFGAGWEVCLIMAAATVMTWVQHRENIGRLLQGKERKLTLRA